MRIESFGPKITSFWEYLKYIFVNNNRKHILTTFFLFLTFCYSFPFIIYFAWGEKPYEIQLEGLYLGFKIINIGVLIFFLLAIVGQTLFYNIYKNRSYKFDLDGTIKREGRKLFLIFNKKTEKMLKIQDLTFGVIDEDAKSLAFNFKKKLDSVYFLGHDFADYDKIIKFILKIKPDLPVFIGRRSVTWSQKDRNKSWRKYEIK